ncbi:MAG: hypothetical protein QNJ23_04275 [Woeseiaceae bacterium]|nr:hypothetical protein [Woeseiaceae bacterium]
MDKLAKRLREDAAHIECAVSDELDDRIRASLENIKPQQPAEPRRSARPPAFWWASSLTGVAAAIVLIAVLNLQEPEPAIPTTEPVAQQLVIPSIEWQAETAVLVSPLEQEFEDLQSDLKKAEEALREDIERLF